MKYTPAQIAKTIGGFIVSLGVIATALVANDTVMQNLPVYIKTVLVSLIAAGAIAGAVFAIPNAQSPEQVVKAASDVGLAVGTAVTQVVVQKAGDAAASAVNQAVDKLGPIYSDEARGIVEGISGDARTAVEDLLGKYKVIPRG